jgi:hypothetical protein
MWAPGEPGEWIGREPHHHASPAVEEGGALQVPGIIWRSAYCTTCITYIHAYT